MLKGPKISVIMPVYNCALYVHEAIQSILAQSFTDFEFLIIDDASTDDTLKVIKAISDPRIRLIEKPKNTGYTHSLNYGITIARGKYIARMDGDDIALPNRLELQYLFMERNLEVVACGTAYRILGSDREVCMPLGHESIRSLLLEHTCFGHPTVMLRKATLERYQLCYDEGKEPAEDYDLWVKLSRIGKLANLDEVLLEYRVHEVQVSKARREQQLHSKWETRLDVLSELFPEVKTQFGALIIEVFEGTTLSYQNIKKFGRLVDHLLLANQQQQRFLQKDLKDYLKRLEHESAKCFLLTPHRYRPQYLGYYLQLYFGRGVRLPLRTALIIGGKSLLFYKPISKST